MNKLSRWVTLELDFAYDTEDLAVAVTSFLEAGELGKVHWRVVDIFGPSGHPIIEVLIERDQAARLLLAYCAGDAEQALELAVWLEPALVEG